MQEAARDQEHYVARIQAFVEELQGLPIAIETNRANEQHYEVWRQVYRLCARLSDGRDCTRGCHSYVLATQRQQNHSAAFCARTPATAASCIASLRQGCRCRRSTSCCAWGAT